MQVSFNDNEVQRLLDDYQKLSGVRIAVFDMNFRQLYASPENLSGFCESIRHNQKINTGCNACDDNAFNHAKFKKDTYVYRCHLGLYEAVTPIYDQKTILGYVMIGQVLGGIDKNVQWKSISSRFPNELCENKGVYELFLNLKQMSIREIEGASRIMKACASSIWLQHLIDIERTPISIRINKYIHEHFNEKIETAEICSSLHISKTTIYNYLKADFNMSLSEYVNHVRLEKAKRILEEYSQIRDNTFIKNNTDKRIKISDIAKEVGFEDYNYFSRKYKEKYAETPRDTQHKYMKLL